MNMNDNNFLRKMEVRAATFEDMVYMCDDDEVVEFNMNDVLAFILIRSNKETENSEYIHIVKYLIDNYAKTLTMNGKDAKTLYDFITANSVPQELAKPLYNIYSNNEKIIDYNYKINYKYYDNKEELSNINNNINECNMENKLISKKIVDYYNIIQKNNDYKNINNNIDDLINNIDDSNSKGKSR